MKAKLRWQLMIHVALMARCHIHDAQLLQPSPGFIRGLLLSSSLAARLLPHVAQLQHGDAFEGLGKVKQRPGTDVLCVAGASKTSSMLQDAISIYSLWNNASGVAHAFSRERAVFPFSCLNYHFLSHGTTVPLASIFPSQALFYRGRPPSKDVSSTLDLGSLRASRLGRAI